MIARYPAISPRCLVVILFLALVLPGIAGESKEMTVDVRLIWGTNDKFSPNTNHTAISPELAARLKNCLKWENYFLVTNKLAAVPVGKIKSIRMSEHCVIEVNNVGESLPAQVRVVGDGKQWGNTNLLADGNDLVICGPAENKTAWIIFLRSTPKAAHLPKAEKARGLEGKPDPVKSKDKQNSKDKSQPASGDKSKAPAH